MVDLRYLKEQKKSSNKVGRRKRRRIESGHKEEERKGRYTHILYVCMCVCVCVHTCHTFMCLWIYIHFHTFMLCGCECTLMSFCWYMCASKIHSECTSTHMCNVPTHNDIHVTLTITVASTWTCTVKQHMLCHSSLPEHWSQRMLPLSSSLAVTPDYPSCQWVYWVS